MKRALSKKIRQVSESETIKLNSLANQLTRKGVHIHNLTAGELNVATTKAVRKGASAHLGENKYSPVNGIPELREAIAQNVRKQYKLDVGPQHIAVTAGAKQALFHALSILCNPGDEVIIPTPAWVSYEHMVSLAGGKPVFVPLAKTFDLDVRALKSAVTKRTKAILINSPHNPTGAVFSEESLKACASLAKKHDLVVVSDDIYNTLLYSRGYTPITKHLTSLDNLIIINGFSKSHALTGWRVGYMVAHQDIVDANNRFQGHTSGNAALPSQYGALAGLMSKEHQSIVQALAKRKKLAELLLRKIPRISFVPPKGAFYIFVDISTYTNDTLSFADKLLQEERVAVVPGEAFQAPGYIRISFSGTEADIRGGIAGLARALTRLST